MTSISHAAAVLAIAALLGAATPVSSGPQVAADGVLAASSPTTVSSSPSPCADGKYNLIDGTNKPHWHSTLRWRYKASTTPSYLTTADVVKVIKRAFNNITMARNDCGRADHVSATSDYLGTTSHAIGVTNDAMCTWDGFNTIGFGAIPAGYLALTCVHHPGSTIDEINIRLATSFHWALSVNGCVNDYLLESVVTHELGHAYGLDHVSELSHGRLTMSRYIDGTCENQEASLGAGDMNGLQALY